MKLLPNTIQRQLIILLLAVMSIKMSQVYSAPVGGTSFSERYSTSSINMNHGLAHNFVDDLFRDSMGYIWVATSGALSRYDGYGFVNFTPNSLNHHIRSTFVRKITEDHHGRLWVATDGGIDVIDLKTLTPLDLLERDETLRKIADIPAGYISTDSDGNIWLRNISDIVTLRIDADGEVEGVAQMPHATLTTSAEVAVKSLPSFGKDMLTAIGGRVCRVTLNGNHLQATPLTDSLSFEINVFVTDFAETKKGVWIGTDVGLYLYDPHRDEVIAYHGLPGVEGMLSQNFVTSLAVTSAGELIVGCLNGLNIYHESSDTFRRVGTADNTGITRTLNNFVNCLLVENENLWVGTEGSGIRLFAPRRLFATIMRHDASDPRSLSPNPVNAIFEDGDGTVWVGTVEGGLNRAEGGYGNGFTHYTVENGVLPHNSVSALTADLDDHLWVGTWGGGLCVLNKRNPERPLLTLHDTEDGRYNIDYVGALAFDPFNELIWIGASSGVFVYDLKQHLLRIPFKGAENMRGSACALVSPDGMLWLGGLEGLLAIDLKTPPEKSGFKYHQHQYKLDHPESMVKEKVTCVAVTHDGTLWVGSNGNGIYRQVKEGDSVKFVNYSSSDGLPNDVAHGISEDLHGNIWIATYHGLSAFVDGDRFLNFGRNSGLDTEQFYWNAYRRLSNGEILFGSVDGMVAVKGLAPAPAGGAFPVRFTWLAVNNGTPVDNPVSAKVPESERSFEVGFSALDYAGERNGRYLYRMKGYEKEWKEVATDRHSVAYMNLSPGRYILEVKYLAQGISMEDAPVSSFDVEIVPYFYKRWWFLLLVAVLILAAVWGIYKWRVRDLTRQRNQLKMAVDDGVREISEQKSLIESHVQELSEQNRELTLRNEQISRQKTQISEMVREVQQLTADRISFFTNITHEFRTPITLIIGPIERALKLSSNPKVIEQLSFVERNSKYLLSLINQLMDFRKIESGKMEMVTRKGNIRTTIDEIVLPFKAYAEERGIELHTLYHIVNPVFQFNEDAIRKVLTNLLGNAIKFTPDNGKVKVYVSMFHSERCGEGSTLYICVSDSGCGIKEEETEKVFEHFYQGGSQIKYPLIGAGDSGIGLYLCRRLVEVYGGRIIARNNKGSGCSFRVLLHVSDTEKDDTPQASAEDSANIVSQPKEEQPQGGPLTMLVVEDNSDMRAFMCSILSDRYKVVEASNGEEALRVLQEREIDFIISDLMMPVMDGMELSRKVKENFSISHIPFLMLTAKTSQEARLEGYRSGVDEYLLKPFDEEMLLARINNILENKRRYQRQFVNDLQVEHLNMEEDSRDKKFVDKVMEVLHDNYTNSYFDVGAFSEALGVSRSLLNKKLQSLLGQSANQLLRSYRMKIAHELIIQNRTTHNLNISEIAFEVGFNDSKYFTRCFTKHFGMNPTALFKNI